MLLSPPNSFASSCTHGYAVWFHFETHHSSKLELNINRNRDPYGSMAAAFRTCQRTELVHQCKRYKTEYQHVPKTCVFGHPKKMQVFLLKNGVNCRTQWNYVRICAFGHTKPKSLQPLRIRFPTWQDAFVIPNCIAIYHRILHSSKNVLWCMYLTSFFKTQFICYVIFFCVMWCSLSFFNMISVFRVQHKIVLYLLTSYCIYIVSYYTILYLIVNYMMLDPWGFIFNPHTSFFNEKRQLSSTMTNYYPPPLSSTTLALGFEDIWNPCSQLSDLRCVSRQALQHLDLCYNQIHDKGEHRNFPWSHWWSLMVSVSCALWRTCACLEMQRSVMNFPYSYHLLSLPTFTSAQRKPEFQKLYQ